LANKQRILQNGMASASSHNIFETNPIGLPLALNH
jgi:hypothetical protein